MLIVDAAVGQAWTDTLSALASSGALLVSVAVAVIESVRSSRARKERDTVLREQKKNERRAVASRITAWIEQTYEPSTDGSHYLERVIAHISNESDVSVYQVFPTVSLHPYIPGSAPSVDLGPLSMPETIAVLPPKREWIADLSDALIVHRQEERGAVPDIPMIDISFMDANGVRWQRDADGELLDVQDIETSIFKKVDDELGARQIGRIDPGNPLAVVFAFITALTSEELSSNEALEVVKSTLAPEAPGWEGLDESRLPELRELVAGGNIGSHVRYPTPFVAYVKLLGDEALDIKAPPGGRAVVPMAGIVTLTFNHERGWRIFTCGGGGTPPDRILFPRGTLSPDLDAEE